MLKIAICCVTIQEILTWYDDLMDTYRNIQVHTEAYDLINVIVGKLLGYCFGLHCPSNQDYEYEIGW